MKFVKIYIDCTCTSKSYAPNGSVICYVPFLVYHHHLYSNKISYFIAKFKANNHLILCRQTIEHISYSGGLLLLQTMASLKYLTIPNTSTIHPKTSMFL
jgi:hypothetical protein